MGNFGIAFDGSKITVQLFPIGPEEPSHDANWIPPHPCYIPEFKGIDACVWIDNTRLVIYARFQLRPAKKIATMEIELGPFAAMFSNEHPGAVLIGPLVWEF